MVKNKEFQKRVDLIKEIIPDWSEEKELEYISSLYKDEILDDSDVTSIIDEIGVDKIVDNIDVDDIVRYCDKSDLIYNIGVESFTDYFDIDDVLDEYDNDCIADYLASNNYNFTDFADVRDTLSSLDDVYLLVEFCKRKRPLAILDKESIKEIVNEYIDNEMINKSYR